MDFCNVTSLCTNWRQWASAIGIVLLCWLLGYVARSIIFAYLAKITEKTETEVDDIIIKESRPHLIYWAILIGIYLGYKLAPIPASYNVYIAKTIVSLFIISVTLMAANIVSDLLSYYNRKHNISIPTTLTDSVLRIGIIALGILMLLSQLGISIAPLLTALGVGSLAVALALQDTLSNLFSGFYILISKQIRPNDYVRLDSGHEGVVVDIGWRSTRIRQLNNNIILLPNTKLASAVVVNFHCPDKEMGMTVPVRTSYSADLERVEKVVLEVATEVLKTVTGGVASFAPLVRYTSFGDSAINFNVILRVNEFTDQGLITHEFIKRLHKRFKQENIEIPFPQRVIYNQK